jgi:hypothetical protein
MLSIIKCSFADNAQCHFAWLFRDHHPQSSGLLCLYHHGTDHPRLRPLSSLFCLPQMPGYISSHSSSFSSSSSSSHLFKTLSLFLKVIRFSRLVHHFLLLHITLPPTFLNCDHHAFLTHSSFRVRPFHSRRVGCASHPNIGPSCRRRGTSECSHPRIQRRVWVDWIVPNLSLSKYIRSRVYSL